MNVHRQDIRGNNRLKYYADLASKLIEDGRLEDFIMIIESVLGLGIEPCLFVGTLNTKLVSVGFYVIEVLSKVEKLGISSVSLFDKSVKKSISLECRRLVNVGKLNDVVETMVALSGFDFPIKHLVDPIEIIKPCVKKHKPNMVVRYACLLPQAQILYTLAIQEVGKKRDLNSALIELLAQKVTPNSYVCNSLVNVNAHDLSYILHVYKEMQTLGVAVDLASYSIPLKACCLAGRVDLAKDIYKEVRDKASTGTLKLDVFADAKMWQMALKTKEDMLLAGVTPNEVTWSFCEPNTDSFSHFQSWKEGAISRGLYSKEFSRSTRTLVSIDVKQSNGIATKNCHPDQHRSSKIIRSSDDMKIASLSRNHISWSILIDIYGTSGDIVGALQGLNSMCDAGIKPDVIAHTTAIKACVANKNLSFAFTLFEEMKKYQVQPNMVEARIVVLAVLRMIKESSAQGIIILGIGEGVATGSGSELEVQDSIVKLLQDELSLTGK
ncbi:hypothetical protein MKW92_019157 [Papaver armeniacum]|nr:hypothetical protein MKW92_019157 [Papaver armeniacum]